MYQKKEPVTKECVICKKKFLCSNNATTCSPECAKIRTKNWNKDNYQNKIKLSNQKIQIQEENVQARRMSTSDIIIAAKKQGMTYGTYVEMMDAEAYYHYERPAPIQAHG